MATRSAMTRLLIAAVVLAVVSSVSAANNKNAARVSVTVKGLASDYLQVSKRNQFCTSFTTALTASVNDLQSCVIDKVVNTATVGEVTVYAYFTFSTARTADAVTTTLNAALNSATPPSGFEKASGTTTPVNALAGDQGTFPTYFAEVEIVLTTDITSANAAAYATALGTAAVDTTATCATGGYTQIPTTGGTAGSKLVCQLTSLAKTRDEMVTAAETAAKAGVAVGGTTYTALFVRDTNAQGPTAKFQIVATTLITGTTAADLTTNTASFKTALLTAFAGLVVDADLTIGTPTNQGTTGAVVDITIKTPSEASANRVLEILKQLIGSSIGTTPAFAVGAVTSITLTPGLFSGAGSTVYPGNVFRYNVVIANTSSQFTTAPYQFRRVCESITIALQGNASACAIVSFDRSSGSGDAGTLSIEVTATNSSAALTLSRNVARAVSLIPATTFGLGAVTEVIPYPGPVVSGTIVLTLGAPAPTTVDGYTPSVRATLCAQLVSAGGYVPAPTGNVVNCFISDSDVVAGTAANTVQVTARVWWRIVDLSIAEYVTALNTARTNKAFATTPFDYNTAIQSAITAGATQPVPATFVFDADFAITTALADFTGTTQTAFATAIRNIVGNSAIVSVANSVAPTGLTPTAGTLVTVRVFTASAAAEAAAFAALAAQVAGTNTTIATSGSTTSFTLVGTGFRKVTFTPAISATDLPVVPSPPPPATPPARPATPPATPPPALPPQAPVVVPVDNGDQSSNSRTYTIEATGTGDSTTATTIIQQIVTSVNSANPNAPISGSLSGAVTNFGKKFVTQNYRFNANFAATTAANAAQLNTRIANAINSGAVTSARIVGFNTVAATTPVTPAVPTAPSATPAAVGQTTGNVDITILGSRSSFTQADQTALTTAVGAAINGTASVVGIAETSTNRKFTMQASALRLTTAVSAPASQYPSLAAIITKLQSVRANQSGRLGNSSVVSIVQADAGAAARSGPVALTLLVALLVAMLSAMAQF